MKIHHVLMYFLAVLVLLAVISLAFPKKGIDLGYSYTLHFLTFEELLNHNNTPYANIEDILKRNINLDSLINLQKQSHSDDFININTDSLKRTIQTLEFGNNNSHSMYPFFEKLYTARQNKRLIRIMHYGDSQIESDRISAFLRSKLQHQFGGTGIGLMPVVQAFNYSFSVNVKPTDNWQRYTAFGRRDEEITHNNFGILASFSRFAPVQNDTLLNDSILYQASMDIMPSDYGYNNAKKFRQLRLICANNKKSVEVSIYEEDTLLFKDTIHVKRKIICKKWIFDDYKERLTIRFSGYDSPDVYCIAMDDTQGIAVDNIALRGSSGTIFTAINYDNLQASFNYLNTELFILQFGGNVLPYITSVEACKNYAQSFYAQLLRLKRIKPDAAIIVVGPADKSIKEKEKFVSYPLIEPLIEEMKKVTFKAGVAYWDIYKAMGGRNSMPSWVNANLAAKDYIHFSSEGASIISNMLYNAIIFEYNNYTNNNRSIFVEKFEDCNNKK